MPERGRTKAEQRERTQAALISAAWDSFADVGYAATSVEQLVRAVGVTRGALYHHFADKQALFVAVLEQVQQELEARVERAAAADPDPWRQLVAGCRAFVAESADPRLQRILLLDAPSVVGWQTWRELDDRHSGRLLEQGLQTLIDAGVLPPLPVAPLLHLLSGAMNEAALFVARSPDPQAALDGTLTALEALLDGLRRNLRTQAGVQPA